MKTTLTLLLALLLSSCYHRAELISERGIIIAKGYSPDTRQLSTGYGLSTSGKMVITAQSVGNEESFNVVIKTESGLIFRENEQSIYENFNEKDSVILSYYNLENRSGEIKDYEFYGIESH